jgi:gluconolactonase
MRSEIVATGITFGEGPVWCGDGQLVVTSVPLGLLYTVDVERGAATALADVGGGANGAASCDDGGFLVTNNGGIDLSAMPMLPPDLPVRDGTPGLQRVAPGGAVAYLASEGFRAPNDLVVAPDGTVYFTDPPHWPPADPRSGRVWSYRAGTVELVADGFHYCNGIARTPEGRLVVVELRGLMDVETREWVVETLGPGGGDGFCYDVEGRAYVASTMEHGVRVVEPDGTIAEFWPIDGEGLCTNCCFGGDDLRTLFVTDAIPGTVVAFEGCPAPGLPLTAFPAPR